MSAHAYRTTRKPGRSDATRERIKAAVRELLAEGTFHTSTVEHVADRAGISRATLYQHFSSRLELIDAICETFDANPALLEIRQIVELPDAEAALDKTIANCIRFWSSEDAVLRQLYGVAAIDPAAQNLVDRQRADRRSELERLTGNLHRTKRLRDRTTARAEAPASYSPATRASANSARPSSPTGSSPQHSNRPHANCSSAAKTPTLAVTPDA